MKKIILVPSIVLLTICIFIGALNVVQSDKGLNTRYRQLTLYESLELLAELDFDFELTDRLMSSCQSFLNDYKKQNDERNLFGYPGYTPDSGSAVADFVLKGFSDIFSHGFIIFYVIGVMLTQVLFVIIDIVLEIIEVIDLVNKFIRGVPYYI